MLLTFLQHAKHCSRRLKPKTRSNNHPKPFKCSKQFELLSHAANLETCKLKKLLFSMNCGLTSISKAPNLTAFHDCLHVNLCFDYPSHVRTVTFSGLRIFMENEDSTFQNDKEMAPKDGDDIQSKNKNAADSAIDEDFEEIERVNESLDSLNSALDDMEKRTDDIRAKLLELLTSNKEIRESIMKENGDVDNNQS